MGQCQEVRRRRQPRRQRKRSTSRNHRGRHRRRSVQGYQRPEPQYPYQADEYGLHRHGRFDCRVESVLTFITTFAL